MRASLLSQIERMGKRHIKERRSWSERFRSKSWRQSPEPVRKGVLHRQRQIEARFRKAIELCGNVKELTKIKNLRNSFLPMIGQKKIDTMLKEKEKRLKENNH